MSPKWHSAEKRNMNFNRPGGRKRKLIQEKRVICQLERQDAEHHESVNDRWQMVGFDWLNLAEY